MKKKESDGEDSGKDLSILLFPTRYKIYNALKTATKPLYASKIADEIGVDRKLVSFHLSRLEQAEFVTSEFGIQNDPPLTGPPKAVRYYTLTDKADSILKDFRERIKE